MSISRSNIVCLVAGLAVGVGGMLVFSSPKDLQAAPATDRNTKFAITSCPADQLGLQEAVFVLDFLNGTLHGGIMNNQNGQYTHRYARQIAADFGINAEAVEPEFAIVGTRGDLRGNNMSKGLIHIAEKTSGKVICYSFVFPNNANPNRPMALTPLSFFQFREAVN